MHAYLTGLRSLIKLPTLQCSSELLIKWSDKVGNRLNADSASIPRPAQSATYFPHFILEPLCSFYEVFYWREMVKSRFPLASSRNGLPFWSATRGCYCTAGLLTHLYYVCTVNLEVTSSLDAPPSRAGAWNCLYPQRRCGRPFQGVLLPTPSPLSKSLNRLLSLLFISLWKRAWIDLEMSWITFNSFKHQGW